MAGVGAVRGPTDSRAPLSIAGSSADMRKYTPPADMEALFYGSARCIPGVAATPDGIPSPVIITMAALTATEIPLFVVDAGCEVPPQTPYFKLGGAPARSLVTGSAVDDVRGALRARLAPGRSTWPS